MNEIKTSAENSIVADNKGIADFFKPIDKTYLHRVTFYIIYLAFLIIPVTAQFLGQFRVGGAFMAIFLGIALIMPWVRYFSFLKSVREQWPAGEKQDELYADFAGSASVFGGEARIGEKYTYFRQERAIVPTKDIKEFIPLRARSGVVIRAMMTEGYKQVTKIAYYKDMMPDLQAMLDEAANCLKGVRE